MGEIKPYQKRFIIEYRELGERTRKLGDMLRGWDAGELFACHGGSIGDLAIASGNAGWLTFMNIFEGRVSHYCPKHVYRRTRD